MDIGKDASDEDREAALSAVVAVGEQVFVKVVEIKEDDGSGRYRALAFPLLSLAKGALSPVPFVPSQPNYYPNTSSFGVWRCACACMSYDAWSRVKVLELR